METARNNKVMLRGHWRPAGNGPTTGWPRSRALILTVAAALVFSMLVAPAMALAQAEPGVAMHHVIMELAAPERLNVREQVILENPGSSPWSPAEPLRFNLPVAAQSVEASGSVDVQVKEGYLEVAGPLPPGMTRISFNYALTSDIPHFDLSREFTVATPEVYLFTPSTGEISIAGDGITDLGLAEVSGKQYRAYVLAGVTPGQVQQIITVGGMTSPPAVDGAGVPDQSPTFHSPAHIRFWEQSPFAGINAHLFLVIVIGIPVALLIYYFRRRRPQLPSGPAEDEELFQRLRAREKVLLQRLGEVEQKFASHQLEETEYERLRELYKKKLVEVKLQLREFT